MQSNIILKGIAAAGAAIVMIFGLTSCGDTHESVMEDQLDLMDEVVDTIDGVKDKESAEEAAEKIKGLGEDAKELKKRMEELGKPSKEVEKELQEKFEKRLKATMEKMFGMMSKTLEYPELGKAMSSMDFGR